MRLTWIVLGLAASAVMSGVCFSANFNVDQVGQRFAMSAIAITAGDSIWFLNFDDVEHNISVFDEEERKNDLGFQKFGQAIKYQFDRSGRFRVRCSIHPRMKMTITVR